MEKQDFMLYINDEIKFADLSLYQCGYEKCYPSHSFGPNMRHFYLIHFVVNGKGVFSIENKNYLIQKNMCFMIPPGVETTYIADSQEPWEYYWIGLHGIEAKNILNQMDLTNNKYYVDIKNSQKIFELLDKLILCEKRKTESKYFIMGYLYQIIGLLVQENNKPEEPKSSYNDELVKKFMKFVKEKYSETIKIADFTEDNNIERTLFSKIFKKHMDISPQNYVINYRLSKSLVLLKNKDLNTLEVSQMVGFNDYKHFLKSFKKQYGITPKEYRKDPFETS